MIAGCFDFALDVCDTAHDPSVNGGDTAGRCYLSRLSAVENERGVMDVDTIKGCTLGMQAYPGGGCYGECYANKTARRYGITFAKSVTRKLFKSDLTEVFFTVKDHAANWYRVGVAGDPCHDWEHTISVVSALRDTGKIPVVITKHWIELTDQQLARLKELGAVFNTSTSGLDTDLETEHRVRQIERIRAAGMESINRVVTCQYGASAWAMVCKRRQDYLLGIVPVIDNPLRAEKSNARVVSGEIILTRVDDSVGGKMVSLHRDGIWLGKCEHCPDQCGAPQPKRGKTKMKAQPKTEQFGLFETKVEWVYVKSVIGSGYEAQVAELAIRDGIAKRAARKNMQIHSAIILKIDDVFSGFFTFQVNDVSREFCLLQSVIEPAKFSTELYQQMVLQALSHKPEDYPGLITTDPKSKFETPALFESVGFKTYLKMSGFHYMVHGELSAVRMKILAHITMTNVWNSVKGDWLRLKSEWRERIEEAGRREGVANPAFASREGCWQGVNGMANVVTKDESKGKEGRAHNGNASVLDPVACEVIARFFMPKNGRRVYNPFGGGVQFGYVAGACGYEYVASEIRQNQCDANNKLCSEFASVKWVRSDSSTYEPEGMFDLVFTCPPYYKVERYVDYDGLAPLGEINSLPTYEQFREVLFAGYRKAIQHLNDNCFFVVMTGDSRNKQGGFFCSESETELFFRDQGLHVYNKIVYLECEFTRLAHAKVTLHTRKFPKREQKIIVAYKGNIAKIKDCYAPIGRL